MTRLIDKTQVLLRLVDSGGYYFLSASLCLPFIAEDITSKGRIDLSIQLPDKVYIIEFKVDQPGRALEQIKEKGYHEKYFNTGSGYSGFARFPQGSSHVATLLAVTDGAGVIFRVNVLYFSE